MQGSGQTGTEATGQVLYMALELSNRKWKLGFSDGSRLRKRTVSAGDQGAVLSEIAGAKARFGLDAATRQVVELFNPLTQNWPDHFAYQAAEIIGITPTGRATIAVLNMNEPKRLELREELLDNAELE